MSEGEQTDIQRSGDGTWLPGQSGNPAGRPPGKKNVITGLKQDLEIAIREGLDQEDVQKVVRAMLTEALDGNVGAGKLILDKVLSNAKEAEDSKESGGGLRIIIENATLEQVQQNIIDGTAEEIPDVEEVKSEQK